jgi:hypothetical protein
MAPAAMMRVDGALFGCALSCDGSVLAAAGVRGVYLFDVRLTGGLPPSSA